jgi:hypothetical protein
MEFGSFTMANRFPALPLPGLLLALLALLPSGRCGAPG